MQRVSLALFALMVACAPLGAQVTSDSPVANRGYVDGKASAAQAAAIAAAATDATTKANAARAAADAITADPVNWTPVIYNPSGGVTYTAFGSYKLVGRRLDMAVTFSMSTTTTGSADSILLVLPASLKVRQACGGVGREIAVNGSMVWGWSNDDYSQIFLSYFNGSSIIAPNAAVIVNFSCLVK